MQTVHDIAEEIVAREGGYLYRQRGSGAVGDPCVAPASLRRLGLEAATVAGCPACDPVPLSRPQTVALFVRHYHQAARIDQLPLALQPALFDMYVNAGSAAVRILQRLLAGPGHVLAVDGIIGPQTVAAAVRAASDDLVLAYGAARRAYYYDLAEAQPAARRYVVRRDGGKGGWILRAEAFLPHDLHLSEADHRARVAAWG